MDIVYTYVNTNNEIWRQSRTETYELYYNEKINNIDSNKDIRYTDNNEFLYSLRSLDKFLKMPIRNVYVIVSNRHQIPKWLNTNNIIVVTHSEIIPIEYLPTFNSQVIELFIHKIPNLSNEFLYFNDDMLLGKEITYDHLYMNGKPVFYICNDYSKTGQATVKENGYKSAWKNCNKILDEKYGKEPRFKLYHTPIFVIKELYEQAIQECEQYVKSTLNSRFRSIRDINVVCSYYPYYCHYNNKGYLVKEHCINIFEDDSTKLSKKFDEIKQGKALFFCMNHHYEENLSFLCALFPNCSRYEFAL